MRDTIWALRRRIDRLRSVREVGAVARHATVALLFGLLVWQPRLVGALVLGGFLPALSRSLLARLVKVIPAARRSLLQRGVRFARAARKLNKMNPDVEVLQFLLWLVAIVNVVYVAVTDDGRAVSWLAWPMITIAVVASFLDIPRQIAVLLKLAWARMAGKLLLAAIAGLSTIAAGCAAKKLIHAYVHVDPQYFQGFQMAATFVFVPIVYVSVCAVVVVLWSLISLIVPPTIASPVYTAYAMLAPLMRLLFDPLRFLFGMTSLSPSEPRKEPMLWYRWMNGKRPPRGYKRPIISIDMMLFFTRHLCALAAVAAIFLGFSAFMDSFGGDLNRMGKSALVALDFRVGTTCRNVPADAHVAYLEKGEVLIATPTTDAWTFSRTACEASTSHLEQTSAAPSEE